MGYKAVQRNPCLRIYKKAVAAACLCRWAAEAGLTLPSLPGWQGGQDATIRCLELLTKQQNYKIQAFYNLYVQGDPFPVEVPFKMLSVNVIFNFSLHSSETT